MKPERWNQLDDLFHAALERAPHEVAAFLNDACAGDDSLRHQVETLLSAHRNAGSFIEGRALEVEARSLADEATDSAVGQIIGHYKIVAQLGVGGMGEVYLAEDTKLGRKVALKLLPADFTRVADRVRRFQQEARAASALNHPNIVTIHEIGEVDHRHFIATEFIDGDTLRQYINGSQAKVALGQSLLKQLKLSEILSVAIQTADALSAAHEARIVHRDIKPENIMVRRRDRYVKVLDFGLAKLTESQNAAIDPEGPTKAQIKTSAGVVMGTVGYMSPEQARAERVDARTDIWSLGVVLYEMVAGCAPFERGSPSEAIASILEHEPPPLPRYARDVPAELERIVSKTLTKDREERYQTAKDLLVDLRRLKQRLDVEAELKRTSLPEKSHEDEAIIDRSEVVTTGRAKIVTADAAITQATRSNADPVKAARGYKRSTLIGLIVCLAIGISVGSYFVYSRYLRGNKAGAIHSVAVLPLVNNTNDPDLEYLSDGISESLINSLSQLPGIKVIARNSSFKFKGPNVDPQEAARALGVDAVLTGRVSQVGDNLAITAELVNAHDSVHAWGEQYNRRRTDVLQLQSEISREIAQTLRLRLTAVEQKQITKFNQLNPQAYELLLKGRYFRSKQGTENRKKAVELFQQAIALDPNYALAYAELSDSYRGLINSNLLDPKEFMPKAEAAAQKALELDESLPEAHLTMAGVNLFAWHWAGAEREIKRALDLNPNLAPAHRLYATYLAMQWRREEAVAELKRVRELDPIALSANESELRVLSILGQNDRALEVAKKILASDPYNPENHLQLGRFHARLGQYREAIAAYQEAIKLGDDSPDAQIFLGQGYAQAGEREKARAILKRLQTGKEYVSHVGFATIQIALGEYDQAFASLETAYAAHDQQLIWLRPPDFDPVRSDPRFANLLRRIGLSP